MEEMKKSMMGHIVDGFFYVFGFRENPAKKHIKTIINVSPTEKLKNDLRRVNSDYRKEFEKMREKAMCLEH